MKQILLKELKPLYTTFCILFTAHFLLIMKSVIYYYPGESIPYYLSAAIISIVVLTIFFTLILPLPLFLRFKIFKRSQTKVRSIMTAVFSLPFYYMPHYMLLKEDGGFLYFTIAFVHYQILVFNSERFSNQESAVDMQQYKFF